MPSRTKLFSLLTMTAVMGIVCTLILSSGPLKYRAQEQFDTSYITTYTVNENGETFVSQEIEITNLAQDVLATTFSLTIRQISIYDISGSDTAGPLDIEVKRDASEGGKTTLNLHLNEKVIGEGRSNKIRLEYKTEDLANKVGQVWNINLPKTPSPESLSSYEVILTTPKSLGPLIFMSPSPASKEETDGLTTYFFDQSSLDKSISATFGINQILNFELYYELMNTRFIPVRQEIALPPDIAEQQQVFYESIDPAPGKIYRDLDGNLLAQYWLRPYQKIEIQVKGWTKLFGRQINPEMGGPMHEIPDALITRYTGEDKYWEVNNPRIRNLANELFDPKKNVTENAYEVYKYVVENLEYDIDGIDSEHFDRHGALKALTQDLPWACMEFSDLFIALTRAMGIPARELNGFAIPQSEVLTPVPVGMDNSDILHSWAEFYDPNFAWVPVDPAWGSTSGMDYFTKLDTNHLAFVRKGLSSERPYPAGTYRLDIDGKQVNVDFAQDQKDFDPKINIQKTFTWNPIQLLRGNRAYIVEHLSGPVLYRINGGTTLLPFDKKTIYLPADTNTLIYENFRGVAEELKIDKN